MTTDNIYFEQRQPGDLDLVQETVNLFGKYNYHHKVEDFLSNSRVISAQGKTSTVQKFLLNAYWYHQVICVSNDSMKVRAALIPGGESSNWLKLFEEIVLPFAIENNLPLP